MRSWFKPGAVLVPVPPLATARVPPNVRVPELVIGPPVRVSPVEPPEPLTEVTVPSPSELVPIADTAPLVPQRRPEREPTDRPPVVVVPVIEADEAAIVPVAVILVAIKFPFTERFPAKVLVAVAEVETKADAVEVAEDVIDPELLIPATVSVPVAVKLPARKVSPKTSNLFEGEVVPIPTPRLVTPPKPSDLPNIVRSGLPFKLAV